MIDRPAIGAPSVERMYVGMVFNATDREVHVLDGGDWARLEHRVVRHSPDGFAWGYGGSGPAELALNIIVDALGDEAWCEHCEGAGSIAVVESDGDSYMATCEVCHGNRTSELASPTVYQAFKQRYVQTWDQDHGWDITRSEVLRFVAMFR